MKSWTLALLLTGLLGTGSSAWANNAVWIDVASLQDYTAEHLVDAVHVPYTHIARGVHARYPDKTTPLKLYDRNQRNAERAQEALQALGYLNVINSGALADLKAEGLTTEQAPVLTQLDSSLTADPSALAQPDSSAVVARLNAEDMSEGMNTVSSSALALTPHALNPTPAP
ncbi:MAG: rhodanese-like domain-containing protein [Candidatus Oceanisphaera merdipullorum]|nr:rhodanese-like domain-containing protein [Candidatus Oceanisphaera merdipullorum]